MPHSPLPQTTETNLQRILTLFKSTWTVTIGAIVISCLITSTLGFFFSDRFEY